ncbi:MAG: hypothetical protein IKR57_05165 [Bacilli bacterium]|nr:hypothetical protein [Bacilli bacterium]
MSDSELLEVRGGIGFSATVMNAMIRGVTFTLELGRTLGTIIRRKLDNRMC